MHILLFDVDGVLVEDRGYRAGVAATLDYFGRLMGRDGPIIDDQTIEAFHAYRYTNEWDICPFAVGVMIVETAKRQPDRPLAPVPVIDFVPQLRADSVGTFPFVRYLEASRPLDGTPSQRALVALLAALDQAMLPAVQRTAVEAVLREMLADPYDITHTLTTQIFQEFVLGSTAYEETYHRQPRFDVPSLLYTEDRAALSPASKHVLDQLAQARRARICVYTARPSLPPADRDRSPISCPIHRKLNWLCNWSICKTIH
jgi:hypothetical protein